MRCRRIGIWSARRQPTRSEAVQACFVARVVFEVRHPEGADGHVASLQPEGAHIDGRVAASKVAAHGAGRDGDEARDHQRLVLAELVSKLVERFDDDRRLQGGRQGPLLVEQTQAEDVRRDAVLEQQRRLIDVDLDDLDDRPAPQLDLEAGVWLELRRTDA